jgi:tetratricopeptide (TPR) repeat protein
MATEPESAYTIVEPAPRRGPGRAFRARVSREGAPLPLDSFVQLRVVSEADVGGAAVLDELAAEHEKARLVRSELVCSPVDFGASSDERGRTFWSVSRWIDGRTLTEILDGATSLPDPFIDAIAKQAADAVLAVHKSGVHAIGLSPDSLLFLDDASTVLLDPAFGAAHAAAWSRSGPASSSLACAAPETIRSRAKADARADLYSLGATLFRAMTGKWPRPDDAQALTCEPESFVARRPSELRPRSSVFLDELVFALLAPDRANRFASFEDLVEALAKHRGSSWWQGLRMGAAQPSREPDRPAPARSESEPSPPTVPIPAPPPDADWVAERRRRPVRLAEHPAPLAGRDVEHSALVDAATQLRRRGGLVRFVAGGAGAGKTRLVDAMIETVSAREGAPLVIAGAHHRLGIGRPMQAFSEALTRLLAADREVDAEQVARLLGDAAASAPAFAAFLSSRERPEKSAPLSRENVCASFARALGALCAASPVVFVVEDLQWADPEGLDLFAQIARLTSEMPLFLVGTYRPSEATSSLRRTLGSLHASAEEATLRLEPLDERETVQLALTMVVPDARGVALAKRLYAATGGVPSRVVESVRLLESERALAREGDARLYVYATERAETAELPDSEPAIWARRVERLGAPERAMLTMAVVQGFAFDAEVARVALKLTPAEAERALASLAAATLVVGTGPARRFGSHSFFDHVHDAIDDAAIEACHAATAEAFLAVRNPEGLPPDRMHGMLSYRVAWHCLLAGRAERGLAHVAPALRHLRSTWRLGDAERLAALAARVLSADESKSGDHVDMLLARAEILGLQGRRDEQRELLDDALLRCRAKKDAAREARALHESARLRVELDQIGAALADGREGLAAARLARDEGLEAKCQSLLGDIAYREARYQDARRHMNKMLETARRRSDFASEAEALHVLGTISQGVGSFDHAEELHRTAMSIYRREGDLVHEAGALASLGDIAAASGDHAKAEGLLRRALSIERAVGDDLGESRVLARLGIVLQESQRCAEAREVHLECVHASRRAGAWRDEVAALVNLATIEYVMGRLDDALDCYGDALRAARELRDSRLTGYALTGLGEVARQHGETEIARGLFKRAVTRFRRSDDQAGLAVALLAAGRVEALGGDPARAAASFAEARELASAKSVTHVAALAVAFQSLLAARRGAKEDALTAMAESAAMVEGVRGGDAARLELHFLHSLVQRVLRRKTEADNLMLETEALLRRTTVELPEDARERVCAAMSPHREILAGAAAVRATARPREREMSSTGSVR